jgi:hypothetical protein
LKWGLTSSLIVLTLTVAIYNGIYDYLLEKESGIKTSKFCLTSLCLNRNSFEECLMYPTGKVVELRIVSIPNGDIMNSKFFITITDINCPGS